MFFLSGIWNYIKKSLIFLLWQEIDTFVIDKISRLSFVNKDTI